MKANAEMESLGNLFEYTDYRVFLRDYYTGRKQRQPQWGLESWARQLNIRSKSMLGMILNGQRHPGPRLVDSLQSYFRFSKEEGRYFSDLVGVTKNNRNESIQFLLKERLAKSRSSGEFENISLDVFSSMSNWFYPAIRELSALKGFRFDADWISHQLFGRVSPRDVKFALAVLERLGLLAPAGAPESLHHLSIADKDTANEAVKRFHETSLDLAKAQIRTAAPEEREYFSSTFAVKESDLPEAKRQIREMANRFADLIESKKGDRIYQLQVSFFPVTRKRSGK